MKKVSFIVPFFNEEKVLSRTVKEIHDFIKKNVDDFEIIFVSDGSYDNSLNIVESYAGRFKNLYVVTYKKNQGRGEAIRQGFMKATGETIGYFDCDLEIKLKYILEALQFIQKYDVVIASKFAEGSRIDTPLVRKISSVLYNLQVKIILGSRVSDHQAGFKFFKKKVIDDILSTTQEKGWLFDTEILYLAQKEHFSIYELPISIRYGYRKLRGTFILDFLKLPLVLFSLKRKMDRRVKEKFIT